MYQGKQRRSCTDNLRARPKRDDQTMSVGTDEISVGI